MKRLLLPLACLGVLGAGVAVAAALDTAATGPFLFHVDQTVTNDDGSSAHLQGDLTVGVSVPEPPPPTDPPPTTTEPPPTTTEPPPPGDELHLTNQKFVCDGPVNYSLVKVEITQTSTRQDGVQIAAGCTGYIGRLEVDTWSADGVHVGAFAHDLVVDGGYVHSHGVCSSCGSVHIDGVQVLGGQRITFRNMDVNYQTATNSALYINCGRSCQDLPTDVVFVNSTFRRSPTQNRVVRIGYSERSGIRNSTVYYCGDGPTCGGGEAIWYGNDPGYTPIDPVNENNTLVLAG